MGSRIGRGALAVSVFAIGLVLAGRAPGAWACSCVGGLSRADHFQQAEVVFAGVVTATDDPGADDEVVSSGRTVTYTFDVGSEQKGDVSDPALVETTADGASCGYTFKVGRRYQVYGQERGSGTVETNTCSGTERLSPGEAPYVLAAGPTTPTTGVDTTVAIVGGIVLIGAAAGLAIRNRRAANRSRRA